MALTSQQQTWLQGFWSYFKKQARPSSAGDKRDGWDAAKRCDGGGGYV